MFNDFNNMPKKLTDDDDVDIKLLDVDSDDDDDDDDKSVNVDDINAGIGIVDINRGNNSKDKIDRKTISISQEGSKRGKKTNKTIKKNQAKRMLKVNRRE